MPTKIFLTEMDGTPQQITLADFAGDYSPAAVNDLRHASAADLEVQLALASVVDGAYRQSAKFDWGANRAAFYKCRAAFEFVSGVLATDTVEVWVGESQHSTAGNGNPGNASGSDSAYTGYSTNPDDAINHLDLVGVFPCTADATTVIQISHVGGYTPSERYGIVVVKITGVNFHSDDVEMSIVFDPAVDESE